MNFNDPCIPSGARNALWITCALVGLVAILGLANHADELAANEAAAEVAAFSRGKTAGRQEMTASVGDAYAQGQRDAIAATSGTPEGVQLAQACMAWWYHAPIDKGALRRRVCGGRS